MTDFCLVRHGSYDLLDSALGGRANYALDQRGRDEAARAAKVISHREPLAILSSPVMRAWETALVIASAIGLSVQAEPDFAEIDFGSWTGASFSALSRQPTWQAWNVFRSTASVPGGETMLAVQARAVGALMHAAMTWPGGEVIIVSHADVIKAILAHFLGSPLDLLRRIDISPGSMSRIKVLSDDARVLDVNVRQAD